MTYLELRTGTLPVPRNPAQAMAAHLAGRIDLGGVSEGERIVLKQALARDPSARWPSCTAFARAMREILHEPCPQSPPPASRRRLLAGAATVVTAALGWTSWPRRPRRGGSLTPAPREVQPMRGHVGVVSAVAYSPDPNHAYSGGFDGTVRKWNLTNGMQNGQFVGHTQTVRSITFTPAGDRMLTASGSGHFDDLCVRIWHCPTGAMLGQLLGHAHHVHHAVVFPDAERVVTASLDGTARVWSLTTFRELARLEGLSEPDITSDGWPRQVWSVAMVPDGDQIACGLRDGTIRIFDTQQYRERTRIAAHRGPVSTLLWPESKRLISGSGEVWRGADSDHAIAVWKMPSLREASRLSGHPRGVRSLVLTPNGLTLFAAGVEGEIVIWDTLTAEIQHTLSGHAGGTWSLALHTSGRELLSGGTDGFVRGWRWTTLT